MISDSITSLDYIIKKYNVDEDNLGVFGYSIGERLALMICSGDDNPYKATGLLAPAASSGSQLLLGLFGGQEI